MREISKKLGISERTAWRDLSDIDDARVRVEEIIEESGVDGEDIWIRASAMFDADLADICDENDNILPVKQWPKIWRQGLVAELTSEDMFERSKDGGNTSWDVSGKRIKIKLQDRVKIMELIAKLKTVDALVKNAPDPKEIAGEVMASIDQAIAEGRKRASRGLIPAEIVSSVKE